MRRFTFFGSFRPSGDGCSAESGTGYATGGFAAGDAFAVTGAFICSAAGASVLSSTVFVLAGGHGAAAAVQESTSETLPRRGVSLLPHGTRTQSPTCSSSPLSKYQRTVLRACSCTRQYRYSGAVSVCGRELSCRAIGLYSMCPPPYSCIVQHTVCFVNACGCCRRLCRKSGIPSRKIQCTKTYWISSI